MKLYATGDSYFGALLNSWIHVMMYGYYTLALLGVKCPWKKYLTMAQLAQFASVMVFTGVCFWSNYRQGQLEGRHVAACVIQVGEMASLFVLFYGFYKKSYKSGGANKKNDDLVQVGEIQDECQAAIVSVGKVVVDKVEIAASASAVLSPSKATKRPTWALGA